LVVLLFATFSVNSQPSERWFVLNEQEYFETRGLNVLVLSDWYNGLFTDSKISGIELIHHEVRTVTNGDVRLNPTPEQWDPIPTFVERKVDKEK
jgi:endoglucanase